MRQIASHAVGKDIEALVIETHAVDDRLIFAEPEQARLWIAVLRQRRHRAAFDKAEASAQHGQRHFGIFVETGRQAHTVAKVQCATVKRNRNRKLGRIEARNRPQPGFQQVDRHRVRILGLQHMQGACRQTVHHLSDPPRRGRHRPVGRRHRLRTAQPSPWQSPRVPCRLPITTRRSQSCIRCTDTGCPDYD